MYSKKKTSSAWLSAAICAAVGCAYADGDPYAGYVKLTGKDELTTGGCSWNRAGNWEDGQAPSSTKDYYVPAGTRLYHPQITTQSANIWNGGKLVIGGVFLVMVSGGNYNAPSIADLTLLPGSEVITHAYGPFYYYDGNTGTVTIASTMANPAVISHHYYESGSRHHGLFGDFRGTAESAFAYTRVYTNYEGKACDNGFYCNIPSATFKNYPGTFIARGGNSIVKPADASTYIWPQTAVRVEDALMYLYENAAFNDSTTNCYMRSLASKGGGIVFNFNSSQNRCFPLLHLTEGLSLDADTCVVLGSGCRDKIPYITPESDTSAKFKVWKLANLPATASVTGISDAKLCAGNRNCDAVGLDLELLDAEDGSKDVYVTSAGIVAMTNANVETTSGSNIAYGAFQAGHAGDWTNLETPPADSTLHYWNKARLCFHQNAELPNATLTLSVNSSWKGGSKITFKEFNILTGTSFGLWSSNSSRTLKAERLNILSTDSTKYVTLYVYGNVSLTINADICGKGWLYLRNNNNEVGTVTPSHINTNFHGRVTIAQSSNTSTKYLFRVNLSDARNIGGEYTINDKTYCAITLDNFPQVNIKDDVTFSDPTRGIWVRGGAKINVDEGKTLTFSNQVTYAGELLKSGLGTMDLASTATFINGGSATAPLEGTNVLTVAEGALRISSATAADGLALAFEEGTRLIVAADCGYRNTKWNVPLTVNTTSGRLPVEIVPAGDEGDADIEIAICTFDELAADGISKDIFDVKRMSNGLRFKGIEKRSNGDGTASFVARMGRYGAKFMIR